MKHGAIRTISPWHSAVLRAAVLDAGGCVYSQSISQFGQTSQRAVSPTWCPPAGSHNELLVPFYKKQQMTALTPAWHKQSSYKALQLEQEDQAIHWKPPHFTFFPMHFCISKLDVTSLNWKTERQILFSFNPTSKKWRSTVICKSPFPLHPKLEGCIYLHHPEYRGHNLPSTKPGPRGDDPCGQQDAGGSGHAMNEKKIILP